jgi:hypothetical protein
MVFSSCALLLAAQLTATAGGTVTHRYSFWNMADISTPSNSIPDSVGTANGTNLADAVVTSGQLVLDGNAYVQLPAGIITNDLAVTIEAWGSYPDVLTQGNWANLFDFGSLSTNDAGKADAYSISFCVKAGAGGGAPSVVAGISDFDDANVNRQNAVSTGNPLASLTGAYVAVVFNPPGGYTAIYVNGSLVGKLTGVTNTITPGVSDVSNLIGWDNWPDPEMSAYLQEFRIWNGALTSLEVAASYQSGSNNINTNAGPISAIELQPLNSMPFGGQQQALVLGQASLITNTVDVTSLCTFTSSKTSVLTVSATGLIRAVGSGSATITASNGVLSSSQSVNVITPVLALKHRYSFNDAANSTIAADSVGSLNGNLMGDATSTGGQLVLDGTSGTYLDLSTAGGVITSFPSVTIDYWATYGALGNWNYTFGFGNTFGGGGQNYLIHAARDGGNGFRVDNNVAGVGTSFDPYPSLANESVHCTTVLDPNIGYLAMFTNGVLAGYAADVNALSGIATNVAYIGKSLWTADPAPAMTFQEVRIYSGALTPAQVALADLNGPSNTNINTGNLNSIALGVSTMQMGSRILPPLIGNYANLPNYQIGLNSVTRPTNIVITSSDSNVVAQAANGYVYAYNVGSATLSVTYSNLQASQLVTVTRPPIPVLAHRYSFANGTANDLVGGSAFNGVLQGAANITGGLLLIPNTAQTGPAPDFLLLPPGILTNAVNGIGTNYNYPAVTVEAWASFAPSQGYWAALFDFGNQNASDNAAYDIHVGQLGGSDIIGISDTDNANTRNQSLSTGSMRGLSNVHVVAVFNPPGGYEALYTNGVLAGSLPITISMAAIWGNTNKIGADLWPDPGMQGSISEFRIYNGALLPDEIAATQVLGPNALLTPTNRVNVAASVSAGNVVLSWPVAQAGLSVLSSPTLGAGAAWTAFDATPVIVGQNFQVTIAPTGAANFFRLTR